MNLMQRYKLFKTIKKTNANINYISGFDDETYSLNIEKYNIISTKHMGHFDGESKNVYFLHIANTQQNLSDSTYGLYARIIFNLINSNYGRQK